MQTVVVFPGLGADYPDMMARFTARFPEAEVQLASWRTLLDAPLGLPQPAATRREQERLRQLEIHALNLLWWRQVRRDFEAAACCGHSLGFYAALVACGAIDEDTSLRLVDTVFKLCWAAFAGNDRPLLVLTTRQAVDLGVLERHQVEVLSFNCARQVVAFATAEQLQAVCRELGDTLLKATPLESRLPFHSRAMTGIGWLVANRLASAEWDFHAPVRPLWSHIHACPLASREEIMIQVIEQLHQKVCWQAMVEAMVRQGCHRFVEVGPNRILGQILRWIDSDLDVEWVDYLRK